MNDTNPNATEQKALPDQSKPVSHIQRNVESIMNQMSNLSALYQSETEALRRADTDAFAQLQEQKQMQVIEYERRIQDLMQNKDDLQRLDERTKEKLREMQAEFSALMQENATALNRMQSTTKRINDLIIKATRRAVHNEMAVNYGARGELTTENRKQLSTGRLSKDA